MQDSPVAAIAGSPAYDACNGQLGRAPPFLLPLKGLPGTVPVGKIILSELVYNEETPSFLGGRSNYGSTLKPVV